jgi:SsrA-binding protein
METITTNRKAHFEYEILDTLEVGIKLLGPEVKSLRDHKANIDGAYVYIKDSEVYLSGMHIDEYKASGNSWVIHEPKRTRKLLLHRKEITRFAEKSTEKGFTIVPLKVYFNDKGIAKVEIAVVRGKKLHDKRETEKKKQADLDMKRAMK